MAFEVYKPRTRAVSNDILSGVRRKRAVTGFGNLSSGEIEGVTRAVLSTEAQKASASERFGVGVREREQARKDAEEAAAAQGRVNLLQTGVNLALIPEQLKIAKEGTAATEALTRAVVGEPAAATTADAVTTAAAGTAVAPAATTDSFLTGYSGQAAARAAEKGATAVAGETASIVAPEAAASVTAEAAAGGLTLATAVGTLGFGMAGGSIGRMFHDSYLADVTGGAISGAVAGTYIFPGVGTVIGGLLGAAGASLDDTVICTELHRRGYISAKEKGASSEWRHRNVKELEYLGYRVWADPVVKLMKKYTIVAQLVRPLGVSWVRTMANRWDPDNRVGPMEEVVGSVLLKVGLPFCRFVHRRKVRYA